MGLPSFSPLQLQRSPYQRSYLVQQDGLLAVTRPLHRRREESARSTCNIVSHNVRLLYHHPYFLFQCQPSTSVDLPFAHIYMCIPEQALGRLGLTSCGFNVDDSSELWSIMLVINISHSLLHLMHFCRYHLHEYGLGEHYNSIVPR